MTVATSYNGFPQKITSAKLSVAALVTGLVLGAVINTGFVPGLPAFASFVEPVGQIWMRLLQMIVVPLIVTQLLLTIASMSNFGTFARLGGLSIASFGAFLVLGAVFALTVAPPLIRHVQFDSETIASLDLSIPDAARTAMETGTTASFSDAIVNFAPTNLAKAVAEGQLLQLMLLTIIFGIAIANVEEPYQKRLLEFIEAVSRVVTKVTVWILRFTPVGVFALAITVARQSGIEIVGVLFQFVVLISGVLIAYTAVLYLVTVLFGGASWSLFGKAVYPSQIVAISTRSSLATVPTLILGAKRVLRLPSEVVDFTIPFAAATFKANRTISSTTKLLFLAHIFSVPLAMHQILIFVSLVIVLSFSTIGVPGGGGSFRSMPLYLALGIPIEGLILAEAVDVIPDIFKTLVNTTGILAVTAIVAQSARKFSNGKSHQTEAVSLAKDGTPSSEAE